MRLFVDSSFFIAYYDDRDQWHTHAIRTAKNLIDEDPEFFISDYIYSETVSFLLTTHPYHGYSRAQDFDRVVIESEKYAFFRINDSLFHGAKEIFFRYNTDKRWSFTDCTSYAMMTDLGLRKVLTFDEHFSEMGFEIIK